MDANTEQALLQRLPHDPEAFRELYAAYLPRVFGYVAARVPGRNDAEDLVSEVFMVVVEKLNAFEHRGAGSFAAWVFRIAHFTVQGHLRRHRTTHEDPLDPDTLSQLRSDAPGPAEALLRKEEADRLRAVVRRLPKRRQEIVSLRYFAGLRNKEIAQVLGINERSVSSQLARALNELQALLHNTPHTEENGR